MALARQFKLDVDLNAQLTTRLLPGVLQQGDAYANVFEIRVFRGKEPADLSNCTAVGYFQRGDSDRVPLDGTIDGNVVTVPLEDECYAVSGDYVAFVRLVNAATGSKVTILRIGGTVETEGSGAILDPSGRIPSIEDVIAQLDEMERTTAEAKEAASAAQTAAEDARNAADEAAGAKEATAAANEAAMRANDAAEDIEGMTVEAYSVPYGTGASAQLDKSGEVLRLVIYTEQGQRGEAGRGLKILGTYETLDALQAAVSNPNQGDMYNVGSSAPYDIYMWAEDAAGWEYQGKLQGATGAHYTPVITENGNAVMLGWTNNGGLENPTAVNIKGKDGKNGENGKTPVRGTDYWTPEDKAELVSDVLAALPNASGVSF